MVALDISHARRRPPTASAPETAERRQPAPLKPQSRRLDTLVVPQSVKGRFRRLKWLALIFCLAVYGLLPFLRWNRGVGEPGQAVLLDVEKGRLYAFSIEIWPQEFYYLTGLLILASLVLILLNALAGRVWRGFLCPQTVWTDLFMAVERGIEGDRRERLRKLGAPMTLRRAAGIALKHAIWLAIALWTGTGLVLYFADAFETLGALATGAASSVAYAWIGIIAALTYTLAGFAREQVCTWMCPWPRLQGAIWDPEALTVNYRDYRGERRISAKKAEELRRSGQPAGDCVDCFQCVVVCPIGIDIREGPNFACINCGLCVDACDSVMTKLNRPPGLIAYESWTNIERGRAGQPPLRRMLRPKTLALLALVTVFACGLGIALQNRSTGSITVLHDRNPMWTTLASGKIRNGYTLRITNKTGLPQSLTLVLQESDLTLTLLGPNPVPVEPGATVDVRAMVTGDAGQATSVTFEAREGDRAALAAKDRFASPPK
jgi:cytochrome c oxidase accessory protein FixG|nr:cytochrome c oxidase accessory protein CcoG [Bradyrhizobium sp. CCH1-B1]